VQPYVPVVANITVINENDPPSVGLYNLNSVDP
jgi:hypothetical protein